MNYGTIIGPKLSEPPGDQDWGPESQGTTV
jgi:hypothetical protein